MISIPKGMDNVRICLLCNGAGEREQSYNLGCGLGFSRFVGKCDHCYGDGVVMQDGSRCPKSVINQIRVANLPIKEPNDEG